MNKRDELRNAIHEVENAATRLSTLLEDYDLSTLLETISVRGMSISDKIKVAKTIVHILGVGKAKPRIPEMPGAEPF